MTTKPQKSLSRPNYPDHSLPDFSAESLSSDLLSAEIVPELGARISRLRASGGREWMWAPTSERRLFKSRNGDDFLSSCLVGADECLPTIIGCSWQGRNYPGHGECWKAAWRLSPRGDSGSPVQTSVELPLSGANLDRTASIHNCTLLLEYELSNTGKASWDFCYAFHPLFNLRAGDRVRLPISEGGRIYVENWDGAEAVWPSPAEGSDLSRFRMGTVDPATLKIFSAAPLLDNRAIVWNTRTRERLLIEFDPVFFSAIGFYANVGGWGGHHHFAIEPTNAQADSLERCASNGLNYSTLPPGGKTTWWIRISAQAEIDLAENGMPWAGTAIPESGRP